MTVYVLHRNYYIYHQEYDEVLGVYDEFHIKTAESEAKSNYSSSEIWVDDYELNI